MSLATQQATHIRVLTVDDHPIMREGIVAALRTQGDLECVGEASNGREAIEQFRALKPDVTLLDLNMPEMDGLAALEAIRSEFSDARIVVLKTYKGDALVNRALKAGARGYLLKSSLRKELVGAIRAAHAGRRYVPAEVAVSLAEHLGSEELSAREIEILRQLAAGHSNKEIANALNVSDETVKTHLKGIFSKLNVGGRTHAISVALERGILLL
jgi:DNA-binding NarL/FixJ family response regulator